MASRTSAPVGGLGSPEAPVGSVPDVRFARQRDDLARPEVLHALAFKIHDTRTRNAVLTSMWGDGLEADTARFRYDWSVLSANDSTPEALTIAASNPGVPIGVVLRHQAADETVLRQVFDRVIADDVRGGPLQDAFEKISA